MRRIATTIAVLGAVLAFLSWAVHNLAANMAARGMNFSLAFLSTPFGVDLSFSVLPWEPGFSHGYALVVAIANTMFVSALAIGSATLLGFSIGILRLSGNPLAAGSAYVVTECTRNVPLLTQIIFLYVGMFQFLPPARQSIELAPYVYLNVRGLFVPVPESGWFWLTLPAAAILVWLFRRTGSRVRWAGSAGVVAAALVVLSTAPWNKPLLSGFSFRGGWLLTPELLAVWWATTIYVSAFIAEIVRSTISSVAPGQREAATALGLRWHQALFLIVLPQAFRAMLPQLTNQYLNIVKATTLGAAIAFPEVVQIMARSIMNQTGRSVEIMLIILAVFVLLNLSLSAIMNGWSRRLEIPGR